MPLRPRAPLRLLALALLGTPWAGPSLHASGTYPPAPPRLRSDVVRSIDPEAYNLGKSIFNGRANLGSLNPASQPNADTNAERLTAVIDRIPDRARAKLDVPTLARHLDAAGIDALLYYLELRFRLTEDVS